jgi:hypothetical protein
MSAVNRVLCALLLAVALASCEAPDPNANTPSSGRLILYVDEIYAPLITALRDTYMLRFPNVDIELHAVPARMAIEGLLNEEIAATSRSDTSATIAAVIGRRLLDDEQKALAGGDVEVNTYVIGYDGLVAAVPIGSPLQSTTLERLRNALKSPPGYPLGIDSGAGGASTQFLVPNQNSSTFMVVRRELLADSNIVAPVRYFATSDSVVQRTVAGDGIALLGWYRVHRDSTRLRPLQLGHNDSAGRYIPPVRVHPATLVTGTYPLKQPIIGYTLAPMRSLANGFLTWLAKSQDAQYFIVYQGMQPENVKLSLQIPGEESE